MHKINKLYIVLSQVNIIVAAHVRSKFALSPSWRDSLLLTQPFTGKERFLAKEGKQLWSSSEVIFLCDFEVVVADEDEERGSWMTKKVLDVEEKKLQSMLYSVLDIAYPAPLLTRNCTQCCIRFYACCIRFQRLWDLFVGVLFSSPQLHSFLPRIDSFPEALMHLEGCWRCCELCTSHGSNDGFMVEEKRAEDSHEQRRGWEPQVQVGRTSHGDSRSWTPEKWTKEKRKRNRLRKVHTMAMATLETPIVNVETMEEGEEEEVWDGEEDEGLCGGGYLVVLATPKSMDFMFSQVREMGIEVERRRRRVLLKANPLYVLQVFGTRRCIWDKYHVQVRETSFVHLLFICIVKDNLGLPIICVAY
ncbi:hypothetical protein V8G54_037307 [Vigna mungo]|uniref:Uncharacterized protein n=1 Tax=Vigna mungo TaxID=3915 RepID=A0AAQ3MJB7_VIGMU